MSSQPCTSFNAVTTGFRVMPVLVPLMWCGGSAHAQNAGQSTTTTPSVTTTGMEEIVVIGYSASLQRAMTIKRESPLVVEALSISELGQLPETSIADSLARLPGLAADRDPNNGASSQISIRGMGALLGLGTLNGRDLATPTPDRNIRYDQFPAELIGGAIIYKSQMASLSEGGVSGTIDLKTVRPLDLPKSVLMMDARAVYNQESDQLARGDDLGYRGSISYIGQFLDKKLGIAVGYAGRSEPYSAVRAQQAGYTTNVYANLDGNGIPDTATFGLSHFARTGTDERRGGVGVLEWAPTDSFHLVADVLLSKVDIDGDINGFYIDRTANFFANDYTNSTVRDDHLLAGTITANGAFGVGANGVNLQNTSAVARRSDELTSIGVNTVWHVGGGWHVIGDVAFSKVDYVADFLEIRTELHDMSGPTPTLLGGQSVTFDGTSSDIVALSLNSNLADRAINLPATLNMPFFQDGADRILSTKLDFERELDFGWARSVTFGARYVDREKENKQLSQSTTIPVAQRTPLTADLLLPSAMGSFSGGQQGLPGFLTFDFIDVANSYFGGLNPTQSVADQTASWTVQEKTTAGYVQLDFGGEAAGKSLTGNIGVRVVKTESESASLRRVAGTTSDVATPFSVANDYTETLPSLNLTFHPVDNITLRFGAAKTIARAPVEDLNAGFQAFDFGTPQAFGGNPLLEPFRANQYDLGGEFYFGENDFIALTVFYKDLETFITTSTQTVDINGTAFQFFQPVNGKGGYIRGFELTYQDQFDKLPTPWDGLGVYFNFAYADSNVSVTRNFSEATLGLLGLSKYVGTATFYYYKSGLELRASYHYRDDFARVVDGGGFEVNDGEGALDAQVSYEVTSNVTLLLQAANLTNEPYRTYHGDPERKGRYEQFGRYFYAGARARF